MSWLLLTVLAVFARATFAIAGKLLSNQVKASPITQSVIMFSLATMLAALLSPLLGGFSVAGLADWWPLLILAALAQALGNGLFLTGLRNTESSTAQIAFSSVLLWGALLSVLFLGSTFTAFQVVGIGVLVWAILLTREKKQSRTAAHSIFLILAAAMFLAVFRVSSARLSKEIDPATYLVALYGGSALATYLMYQKTVTRELKKVRKQGYGGAFAALFASSTSLMYFVFSFYAYKKAPDSGVVVLLLATQVVFSVLFSIVFLKETKRWRVKVASGFLAVIASLLISH